MRGLKLLIGVLALMVPLAVAAPKASAQISIGVHIGGPPPVCPYGYYDYPPYACAPYGFYGPGYFYNGIFLGVGPWANWGYSHGWGGHRFTGARGGHYVPGQHAGGHVAYHGGARGAAVHGGGHPMAHGSAMHGGHAPAAHAMHGGGNAMHGGGHAMHAGGGHPGGDHH